MSGIDLTLTLNIDLDLLREQKAILVALLTSSPFTKNEKEMADEAIGGVISLIDGIQDEAAEVLDRPDPGPP